MRDRKNRRVATVTRLRLKRRKQKRYGRVQIGLGIIFFLCVGILFFFLIRQFRDDAGQRQMMQENFFQADTQEEFDDWYENIKAMSLYDAGVTAEYGDEFITLSCCSYQVEDGRFVVVGKRIK